MQASVLTKGAPWRATIKSSVNQRGKSLKVPRNAAHGVPSSKSYGNCALGDSSPLETNAEEMSSPARRAVLLALAAAPLLPNASLAEVASLEEATDGADGFTIGIPQGWTAGQGQLDAGSAVSASRRALAWFPGDSPEPVNITLLITNSSADYTKLGSFGSADDFGTNLVNSMDRSYLLRAPKWARKGVSDEDIQVVRLVKTASLKDSYQIEYTVKNSKVEKYLFSLVSLGFNGMYNRLYTITAQCPEAQAAEYRPLFEAVFKSFKFPATKY